jgi:hypothetical protein
MQASERVTERSIPHYDIAGSKEILNNGTGQTENTCELDRASFRPLNKKINFGIRKKRTNSLGTSNTCTGDQGYAPTLGTDYFGSEN